MGSKLLIGVISDTHGLLRPEAARALQGVDRIIHAGDVGKPEIPEDLGRIAPLSAVRGNVDRGEWARALPQSEVVEAGGVWIYVLHDISELDLDPLAAGFRAVIYGHSHKPEIYEKGGVLFLNPGSAGPRRFKLPVTIAVLDLQDGILQARLIELEA